MPSSEGGPPAGLEDAADEEEYKPILESGGKEKDGCKGHDGSIFCKGVCKICEVCRKVAQVHDKSDKERDARVEKRFGIVAFSTAL